MEQAVLIGLASFRIANLLVNESGPFDIFEKLRQFIGQKPGEISGFLPLLFSCIFCISVWTTLATYLLWLVEPVVVIIIAGMGVVLLVDKYRNG